MQKFTRFFNILLFFLTLFCANTINAQFQLPNSGFETFETGFNGEGEQPTSWKGSNVVQTVAGFTARGTLVNSSNSGHTGNCVYLHVEEVGAMGITAPAPAFVALGTPWNEVSGLSSSNAIGGCTGGLAFTHRPDTLSLWIKRTYTNTENAHVMVYLWSGISQGTSYINKGGNCQSSNRTDEQLDVMGINTRCTTTQLANLIGSGEWVSNQQFTGWTEIKIPVRYFNNSIPEKINVIISAANYPCEGCSNSIKTGSKLWADDLSLQYSSKIDEIRINNRSMSGFNTNTLTYTYSLGVGVVTIPPITVYRSGRQLSSSEILITNGTVGGVPTTIRVNAEDGSSSTTYTINFVAQQSTNSRLSNIFIDGNPLTNFNGYVTGYNVELPYGTTVCPTLTVQKAETEQTFIITSCTGIPGSATITVFAEDILVSQTYTINYTVAALTDNTLQDILVNGVSISGFSSTRTNYTVELPLGTTTTPIITPVSAYASGEQTIVLTNNGLSGTSTIVVSAGNSLVRTYRITFTVTASSYACLNSIRVGGTLLANFDAETLTYNCLLPRGTTVLPAITWTLGEANQTATLTAGGVNGETRIMVQAQNGNMVIYKINFSVERSEVSTLNDILVDGQSISGFRPDSLNYTIQLPSGTTVAPTITYVLGDYAQTVRVTSGGLTSPATIRVTAENTVFSTIYTVNFSVTMSANAQLASIIVDGSALAGFSQEIFSYDYILPNNATVCPEIEVVKASVGQQIVIVKPQLAGLATIEVTPETGGSSNVYAINFAFAQSNNYLLDSIQIDNVLFATFNPATYSYTITLPAHSEVPEIKAFASDSASLLVVVDNGLDSCRIVVTAENGEQNIYKISYNVLPSTETGLTDIQLWNSNSQFVSLTGFDTDVLAYSVDLAWGTAIVPVIHPVKLENTQTVSINYGGVNDTTRISVHNAALSNVRHYSIIFNVEESSVATLSSILLDGNEIGGFDPNTLSYTVVLPYGTTSSPQIGYEKAIVGTNTVYNQLVKVTDEGLYQPATLEVTAEDGTTNIYTLYYQIDMSAFQNGNYLTGILMDGVSVDGFDSQTADYDIVLPYGTTQLPDLVFLKNYQEQTVFADYSEVNGTTTITVKSNIAGVADMVYNLHFSASNIEKTVLTDILIDGVPLANFDPTVKTYILPPVTTPPVVTYSADLTKVAVTETDDHKHVTFKVEDIEDSDIYSLYTVYFFYQDDVIPNPSFENWSPTAYYSKQKPTSWFAPADDRTIPKCTINFFTDAYAGGNEVTQSTSELTNGTKGVYLQTKYNSNGTWVMPGLITLGEFHSFGSCITSSYGSSVTGGINFRNTPDNVLLDYKITRISCSDNMRFDFQLWNTGTDYSATESVAAVSHTDGATSTGWITMNKSITYNSNNMSPQRLNIIINASYSAGIETLYKATCLSDRDYMYADNLRFEYSSKLSDIAVNGVVLTGFDPNTLSYNVDISPEYLGVPQIVITGQVPDQEHRIVISDEVAGQRTATITSIAEDGSQTVYTLNIARANSTVDVLTDIIINGTGIADFRADSLDYTLTIANGYAHLNSVAVIKGEGHQSVDYQIANDQLLITVTAEDGTENVYTINLKGQQSNNSTLVNIDVEGYPTGFAETTTSYQVTLSASTKDIPSISYTKQTDGQTVIFSTKANNANDTVFVQVISQDRLDTTIYSIAFDTQAVVTSKLLTKISIENVLLDNFDKNVFEYQIVVSGTLPKLTFEREFEQDSVSSTHFSDSVVFEVGNANVYKVVFVKAQSNNALLNNISVNGQTITGFAPTVFEYSVDNTGNNYLPQITIQPDKNQIITVTRSGDKAIIEVAALGNSSNPVIATNEYSVEFVASVPISNDSVLAGILLDRIMIAGFEPDSLNYAVSLPEGTTLLPEITVIRGDSKQTVQITTNGVNGTTQIVVTSENGSQTTYTIDFSVLLSDYALLNLILVNGVEVNNFAPDILNYSYTLPYGTTVLPSIEYEKGHIGQTVAITPAGVNGDCIITVTSESGNVINSYTISFSVEPSNNSALRGITVDGENIAGFDAQILEYKVSLPYGTTRVPVINCVVGDSVQNIVVTQANTLSDTAVIVVTAQNGINRTTYRVSFEINLSNNACLADILISGEPLRTVATGFVADINFNSEEFYYNVTLPYGTTSIPEIEWIGQVADYDIIQYFEGNLDALSSRILVVSQDLSNTNEYFITFAVAKSNNSRLNDILVNGVSINGFNSDTLAYHIKYPVGTPYDMLATAESITYILGEEHQTVIKTQTSDNTIIITVTAQDGVSQSVYIITQEILLANNAYLADILVNNVSLDGFSPQIFDYEYVLPFGTSQVPNLAYIKAEEAQTVDITKGFVNERSYIYVTAEDGITSNVYSVLFKVSGDNPGDMPSPDDVCLTYRGDGIWQASSRRNSVSIVVYSTGGALMYKSNVIVADPNDDLCSGSVGTQFRVHLKGVFVYSFIYNNKRTIESKKAINR
ncbi:MAG: hypothetical protein LBT04_06890 [Prevotellaceae bacterium]|jgi:hypothetical protein|nr:hypothetical protein [Prevotellaceae bacterium]